LTKRSAANPSASNLAANIAGIGPPTAEIIAFPRDRVARRTIMPDNRLGIRERIEALTWAAMVAGRFGYTRVRICDGGQDPEIGDFVLIYEAGREWASFGVSRDDSGFSVWRTSGRAGSLGGFTTMRAALDAVITLPKREPKRPTIPVR
jgi:hypothetical protein